MYRQFCVTFGAATIVAAFMVTGCANTATTSSPSAVELTTPGMTSADAGRPTAPLPASQTLIDVLTRLTDPEVPGAEKLNLIEGSTSDTAGALDKFTAATRDGGYLPMSFATSNIGWSAKNPSDVTATIVVTTAQPKNRKFTFPMEFTPLYDGWQLSRRTADMLLAIGSARGSTPGPALTEAHDPASGAAPSETPPG